MEQIKDTALLRRVALQLKHLRRVKNVTQDEVFFDTNIHIARLETGKINPSVSTLSSLCKYFDVTVSEFFGAAESM